MRSRSIILCVGVVVLLDICLLIAVGAWWFSGRTAVVSEVRMQRELPVPLEAPTPEQPVLKVADSNGVWARIESPVAGESVPRNFVAMGKCSNPPPGSQFMLVVDSGRSVFSPKMPPLTITDGVWKGDVREYGAPVGGEFSLCIFVITDEAVQRIAEWNLEGKTTGKYPPFRGAVPGGVELGRHKLRVRSN